MNFSFLFSLHLTKFCLLLDNGSVAAVSVPTSCVQNFVGWIDLIQHQRNSGTCKCHDHGPFNLFAGSSYACGEENMGRPVVQSQNYKIYQPSPANEG